MGGVLRVLGNVLVITGLFLIGGGFREVPLARSSGGVLISEVAWMGSNNGGKPTADAADEWIELYNQTSYAVDLAGWTLEAADRIPSIVFSSTTPSIPAGGFFLLERTNDSSVPGVTADVIYTGVLGNGGEVLILKDNTGNEIDRVDAATGWPAGDKDTKETMQWTGSNWITAEPTPRTTNKSAPPPPPPAEEPEPEPESPPSTPPPTPEPQPLSEPTPEPAPGSVSQPASTSSPTPQQSPPKAPPPAPPPQKPSPVAPVVSPARQALESSTGTDNSITPPLASVSETLSPEKNAKKFSVVWIVVSVLLVLVAGLLWVVRAQRAPSRDKNIFPE